MQRKIRHYFNLPWRVLLKEQVTQSTTTGALCHRATRMICVHLTMDMIIWAVDQICDEIELYFYALEYIGPFWNPAHFCT